MPRLHFSFRGRTRSVLAMRLAAASILLLFSSSLLIQGASAGQFTRPKAKVRSAQKFTPVQLPMADFLQSTFNPQNGNSTPAIVGSFSSQAGVNASISNAGASSLIQLDKLAQDEQIYQKLQQYVVDAALKFDANPSAYLTEKQKIALAKNPDLASAYRGSWIDKATREAIQNDALLKNRLVGLPNKGVDFTDLLTGKRYDMTTLKDFPRHVKQYGPQPITLLDTEKHLQKTGAVLPEVTLQVENPGLIQKIGAWIQKTFPAAAKAGQKFLSGAGQVLGKLGPLFAVAGLIFGLMELGCSGGKLLELMQRDGILGALGEREGQIDLLHVLAGFFNAVSGGAFVLGAGIAATGIGIPAAAVVESVAITSLVLGALFTGGALVLENLDAIKDAAKKTWDTMQAGAAQVYSWVQDSAAATAEWAKQTANNFVDGTRVALAKAGKWVDEKARQAWEATQRAAVATKDAAVDAGKFVYKKLSDGVSAIGDLFKGVGDVSEKALKRMEYVVKTGTRWVEKEVEQVKEVVEKVVKTGERVVEKVVDVIKQVPRTIYETTTRVVEKVVPVVKQVTEYVTTKVEETYQYATQVTRDVTEWVTERAREAYQVVRQVPRQVTEFVTETIKETKQVAHTVYDRVTNYATQWVQETVPVVRRVARTVWDTVTSWVPQTIRTGWGRFVSWVTQWVSRVTSVARTVYDTVTDYVTRQVQRVVPVVTSVARTVYDTVTNWVTRTVPVVKTVYDRVVDTAYRWVEKPVQRVKQVVDTVWQTGKRLVDKVVPVVRNVTEYVTQKAQETYQVAKTVYDTVTEKIPQLVKETYQYVVDVPKKVVEKVKVMVQETYQTVQQMAPVAANTMNGIPMTRGTVPSLLVNALASASPYKADGSLLTEVFNDKTQLAEHAQVAVTAEEFIQYIKSKSVSTVQNEADTNHAAMIQSTSGRGPIEKFRYVIDPADPNKVIDMRHFMVVGPKGEAFGLGGEILQKLGNQASAFNNQDFFSNALGARFFESYNPREDFSTQLENFFKARASHRNQN